MIKVKICGLKRKEDIKYINGIVPDYAGFIFAESRRKLEPDKAKRLINMLSGNIKAVGVFVNEDIDRLIKIYKYTGIEIVQLHGDEDDEYIEKILEEIEIWKAVRVRNKEDIKKAERYLKNPKISKVLLDAYHEEEYGGSGISFNWNLIKEDIDNLILAGGLNQENIERAVLLTEPETVDISSGVETDGNKDYFKIKNFVEKVRNIK